MPISYVEIYKHNVAATNWIANPGAETDTSGMQGVNGTLARTTSQFRSGTASFQVTKTASGTGLAVEETVSGTSAHPVTPNTPVALAGGFRPGTGIAVGSLIKVEIQWYNSSGTATTLQGTTTRTTSNQTWYGFSDAMVVPTGAAYGKARFTIIGPNNAAVPTGAICYFDDLVFGPLTTPVLLPNWSTTSFDLKYNEAGALSFTYPADQADALGITDGTEIGIRVGFTDTTPVDVEHYTINGTGRDKVVDDVKLRTFNAASLLDRMKDAVVYPSNWPVAAPTGHSFVDATVGTIMKTLMQRAQARGTLTDIGTEDFSGTADSNGAAWTALDANGNSVSALFDMDYSSGQGYDAVLQDFMDRGYVDAWVDVNHALHLVTGGSRGAHVSIGTLEVRPGYNIAEMSVDTSAEDTASAVLMEGEEGTAVEVAQDNLRSLLNRRRERYVSQGGVADAGVLQLLGAGELQAYGKITTEETIGFGANLTPFKDFQIADWIQVRPDTDKPPVERRVRQIAVSVDENRNITVAGTLNDFLYEAEVRNQRRLDAIAGGSGSSYGGGATTGSDNTIPNPPSGVGITSGYITTPTGDYTAAMTINWTAPTTNVGGSAITDIDHYDVQWRYSGDTVWSQVMRTAGTETTFGYSPVTPGLGVEVHVRTVDSSSHPSDWTATATATIAKDVTAPNPPSAITATGVPGGVRLYWDGKDNAGNPMPSDFSDLEIWEDTVSGSTPGVSPTSFLVARISGSGYVNAPGRGAGVICYYVARAYDKAGNVSGLSTQTSAAAQPQSGGSDGAVPSTAPTITSTGGIGTVSYRWTAVTNADPVTYKLFVRAGSAPTTTSNTYLVANGNLQQATVRSVMSPVYDSAGNQTGEAMSPVAPGINYYAIVVAVDADGQGPNSTTDVNQSVQINTPDIAVDAITADLIAANAVTTEALAAGSVTAVKFEAVLALASRIEVGDSSFIGLDPDTLNPNLLPNISTLNSDSANPVYVNSWFCSSPTAGTSVYADSFIPAPDDPVRSRFSDQSFAAATFSDTSATSSSSIHSTAFITQIAVEPDTEYRLTYGAAFPGYDPNMATNESLSTLGNANAVQILYSPGDITYANADTGFSRSYISWKSFHLQRNPHPNWIQWDEAVIKTGPSQTAMILEILVPAARTLAGTAVWSLILPTLRKETSNTVTTLAPSAVSVTGATNPDPTITTWRTDVSWSTGTPTTTRQVYTPAVSSFAPPVFGLPGRYGYLSGSHASRTTIGTSITSSSSAAATATFTEVSPTVPIPDMTDSTSRLYYEFGLKGPNSSASTITVDAYWFDASNVSLGTSNIMSGNANTVYGMSSATENFWSYQLTPPAGATQVGFKFTHVQTSVTAGTNAVLGVHGSRLYSLVDVNNSFGAIAGQHVEIDSAGVRMLNQLGQVQVNIPTDSADTAVFKGDVEAQSLRILGGTSFESAQNEIAKDASLSLSAGIKSPVGTPTMVQEYEQYTVSRTTNTYSGFSTKPTLNPANITSMAWAPTYNAFIVMENRGGGVAEWFISPNGSAQQVIFQPGWTNCAAFWDPRGNYPKWVGTYAGHAWFYFYHNSGNDWLGQIPDGQIPTNNNLQAWWHPTLNYLYVFWTASSILHIRRYIPNNTTNQQPATLVDHRIQGSGTGSTVRPAGAVSVDLSTFHVAYANSGDVKNIQGASGGTVISSGNFPVAASPVAFTHDGSNFWQIDSAGKLTKYSNYTWSETNHKFYAGITWYDADAGGTGIHETDLVNLASVTAKKRISNIRLTLPQVPDKGGADDPNQWRLYMAKAASLTVPTNRTSFWLQASGGSPSGQTSYSVPAGGLITSGTNPPATNNFPGAGAGKIISAATDSSSNPLISLDGGGAWRLGDISGDTTGRSTLKTQVWNAYITSTQSIPNGTTGTGPGGWTLLAGFNTAFAGFSGTNVGASNLTSYSGGILTANFDVWIDCMIQVIWDGNNTTGRRLMRITYDNTNNTVGQAYSTMYPATNSPPGQTVTWSGPVAQGHTIAFHAFQDSGGSLNVSQRVFTAHVARI